MHCAFFFRKSLVKAKAALKRKRSLSTEVNLQLHVSTNRKLINTDMYSINNNVNSC